MAAKRDVLLDTEKENFVRVFTAISEKGKEVLINALLQCVKKKHDIDDFAGILNIAQNYKKKMQGFVCDYLWHATDPPKSLTQLDITALYALLNVPGISGLQGGDLKQSLLNVKNKRNELCHDKVDQKIRTDQFQGRFEEIKDLFRDVRKNFTDSAGLTPIPEIEDDDLDFYKTCPVTEDTVKKVKMEIDVIKSRLEHLEENDAIQTEKISKLEQHTTQMQGDINSLQIDVEMLKKRAENDLEVDAGPVTEAELEPVCSNNGLTVESEVRTAEKETKSESPTKQMDFVLFFCKQDQDAAEKLHERLTRLNFAGALYNDTVALGYYIGSEIVLAEELTKNCTYKLFYITDNLTKESDLVIQMHTYECLMQSLKDKSQRWSFVPVFSKSKSLFQTQDIPYGLLQLTGLTENDENFEKEANNVFAAAKKHQR